MAFGRDFTTRPSFTALTVLRCPQRTLPMFAGFEIIPFKSRGRKRFAILVQGFPYWTYRYRLSGIRTAYFRTDHTLDQGRVLLSDVGVRRVVFSIRRNDALPSIRGNIANVITVRTGTFPATLHPALDCGVLPAAHK